MKEYHFITHWKMEASLQDVWEAIHESEKWPEWWKSIRSVKELKKGDDDGIGSIRRYLIRSPMLYTLSFDLELTQMKKPEFLEGNVSGELQGKGSWHFMQDKTTCKVTCHWKVATNVRWMNALSWLLKPVFQYNHSLVMKEGAKSLSKKLQARLISY